MTTPVPWLALGAVMPAPAAEPPVMHHHNR